MIDLKDVFRSLSRSPRLCIIAISVVCLAGALAASVFSVVDSVLLRPLSHRSPEEMRFVYGVDKVGRIGGIAMDEYERVAGLTDTFSELAASGPDRATLSSDGAFTDVLTGEMVSTDYFSVLGVRPVLGRALATHDMAPDAPPVVVISERLFRRRFNGDPTIIGQHITLKPMATGLSEEAGRAYMIVGVAPADFRGLTDPWDPAQYWVSLHARAFDYACEAPDYLQGGLLIGVGRLKPGVSDTVAAARVEAIPRLFSSGRSTGSTPTMLTLLTTRRITLPFDPSSSLAPSRLAILLFGLCASLFAIAAVNLIGLLLARNVARSRETAVRLMLGASRMRLMRLALYESAILSFAGCALGVWLAVLLTQVFAISLPLEFGPVVPRSIDLDVSINGKTVMAMMVVAVVVSALIAAPLALRQTSTMVPRSGSSTQVPVARSIRRRLQWAVVFPQIALSVMLLVVAAVLIETAVKMDASELGYDTTRLAFVEFELPRPGRCRMRNEGIAKAHREATAALVEAIERTLPTIPAVESSALALFLPPDNRARVYVKNMTPHEGRIQTMRVVRSDIGHGYFRTLGVPLLQGRDFDARDQRLGERVVIVSRLVADQLWPNGDALGGTLGIGNDARDGMPRPARIVGIVGDVGSAMITSGTVGGVYLPTAQGLAARTVVVKHFGDFTRSADAVRNSIKAVDSRLGILRVGNVQMLIDAIRYPRRAGAVVFGAAGVGGVALACLGLYGLLAYSVKERTREIAIRTALGATRQAITRLVLRDAVAVGTAGITGGILLAYLTIGLASRLDVPLPPIQVASLLSSTALVALVTLTASYRPARIAATIDPLAALRQE